MSRRIFTLVEGSSNKFWAITLEGSSHTVEFGRVGSAGQSTRKEFGSEAEAKASLEKLVAEKVRKGYAEQFGGATAVPPAAAPKARARAKPEPEPEPEPGAVIEPEVVEEPAPAPAPPSLEEVEPSIDLDPADRSWATWEPARPIRRPAPGPFDREAAMDRFRKVAASDEFYQWKWTHAKISANPSVEEARFWLSMIEQHRRAESPKQFFARVETRSPAEDRPPDFAASARKWDEMGHRLPIEFAALIFRIYPFEECLDYWEKNPPGPHGYVRTRENQKLFEAFFRFVRPYLDADRAQEMREQVRARLPVPAPPPDAFAGFPMAWYMASALGLSDEVAGLLRVIPDTHYRGKDNYAAYYQQPQWLVLGLGDPGAIEAEWRRLGLTLRSPEQVGAWLATTGFDALDVALESILACTKADEAQALTLALGRARGPRVAPVMLELVAGSKAPKPAGQWLAANPRHAIAGLVEVAGGKGRMAEAALGFLRERKKKGQAEALAHCLESASAEVAARVRREVLDREEVEVEVLDDATTPEELRSALRDASGLKPPAWVTPGDLPMILVDGRAMAEGQVSALLAGLARSTLAEPHPVARAARGHADRRSLDAFAWALFERWRKEGTPSKEKWAMLAIGLLGSDGSALKLTPLIRAWPGESQHARAVTGLECLRAIGTDGAMMQLNGIAQKLPFKGLKAKAAELMEAIARDRQMTRAQLEDRIVPDCDLDDRGSRIFDFGPRQFQFVLGGGMKPMVRDAEGKLKADLPKPGLKDDPASAAAAVDAWKLLKKQVREVAKVQAERLEQAMVIGRRWSVADFEALLVGHPLMTHLVRMVVWGGYDEAGRLAWTFRVTEERDYADSGERAVTLDGLDRVGVVHPLHLDPAVASAWGEVFGDYEIIPPFPQLGRAVHRLEPGEETATDLKGRVVGKVPSATLVGILERGGWERGIPEDAGIFSEHLKAFEGANFTAVIQYDGIPVGGMIDWDDQAIQSCFFLPGLHSPRMYPDHNKSTPLGRVDPVVISEVIGTLGALASKAR